MNLEIFAVLSIAGLMDGTSIPGSLSGELLPDAAGMAGFAAMALLLPGMAILGKLFGGGKPEKVEPKSKIESLREQKELTDDLFTNAGLQDIKKVRKILEQGIDVNTRKKGGETALFVAVRWLGRYDDPTKMVAFLLANGADANLHATAKPEHDNQISPLNAAAYHGYIAVAKILVESGAHTNAPQGTRSPLMLAAQEDKKAGGVDNKGIVKLLAANGADVNHRDEGGITPLFESAKNSNTLEMMELLLELGADINVQNDEGLTPLMEATRRGHDETIESLLKHGADISLRDKKGKTAYAVAKEEDAGEFVMTLLEDSARESGHRPDDLAKQDESNLDGWNEDGETKLMVAVGEEDAGLVKELLAKGASIDAVDDVGKTALIHAADYSAEMTEILLQAGAKIDIQDGDGQTPLMIAIDGLEDEVIEVLLKHRANLSIKDKKGKTAMDIAKKDDFEEAISMLKKAGA